MKTKRPRNYWKYFVQNTRSYRILHKWAEYNSFFVAAKRLGLNCTVRKHKNKYRAYAFN